MEPMLSITADDCWKTADRLGAFVSAAAAGDPTALADVLIAMERRVCRLAWRLVGYPSTDRIPSVRL